MKLSKYDKQAHDFATKTGLTMEVKYLKHGKHFDSDKEDRDIYQITLRKSSRSYTFQFGQSLCASGYGIAVSKGYIQNHFNKTCFTLEEYNKLKPGYMYSKDIVKNENFEVPRLYSVLTCLTKDNPGTLEDFCDEYGYDVDSKKAEKTYKAVLDEWHNVVMLFNDEELDILRDIQ